MDSNLPAFSSRLIWSLDFPASLPNRALVLDQGYSHIDACRSLGVVDSALRRWVKQLEAERQGVTPKSKALTPEQQKIQELEARINRLEREKAILKKATALLMSDELDRTR